jgi:hypothetical protein
MCCWYRYSRETYSQTWGRLAGAGGVVLRLFGLITEMAGEQVEIRSLPRAAPYRTPNRERPRDPVARKLIDPMQHRAATKGSGGRSVFTQTRQ